MPCNLLDQARRLREFDSQERLLVICKDAGLWSFPFYRRWRGSLRLRRNRRRKKGVRQTGNTRWLMRWCEEV